MSNFHIFIASFGGIWAHTRARSSQVKNRINFASSFPTDSLANSSSIDSLGHFFPYLTFLPHIVECVDYKTHIISVLECEYLIGSTALTYGVGILPKSSIHATNVDESSASIDSHVKFKTVHLV